MKQKTILFEKKFGVDINNINSTEEVDEIIENKIGRKMEIINTNILPIKKYEITNCPVCGVVICKCGKCHTEGCSNNGKYLLEN